MRKFQLTDAERKQLGALFENRDKALKAYARASSNVDGDLDPDDVPGLVGALERLENATGRIVSWMQDHTDDRRFLAEESAAPVAPLLAVVDTEPLPRWPSSEDINTEYSHTDAQLQAEGYRVEELEEVRSWVERGRPRVGRAEREYLKRVAVQCDALARYCRGTL